MSAEPDPVQQRRSRRVLAGVLVALFAALLAYRVLHAGHLEETAVFYVGIPAVIAIMVALVARPKSALGTTMAVITIGLALSGPLLGEGIVCLVFAAPLFYLVGLFVGLGIDFARKRGPGAHLVLAPLLVALVSEGATGATSLPRENVVSATRPTGGADVAAALAVAPRFPRVESAFLRLGFPRPLVAEGAGLQVGATRRITFTPRRSLGIGAPLEPRSMTLRVKERGPGVVVFDVVADTTLARWLDLEEARFAWTRSDLTVSLRYRRTFDPAWYFGPIQRYGLGEAAGYLAETFARPGTSAARADMTSTS
ncbi:hypothetical protein [Nonomuraea roseoviolacea]|uniref:SRPBCC family protein n=1 Tax=Nonomuraea roseoviolacea subsp. carminata TaxID=160689 RepID=A0ABT1JWK9_9ACTN|nr:hypothetical protein [Nonomuraea roseoviolacea]MCP2345712.1 hypothetical protein [Nonomuraea roseoviolacea subsp. carminata]